MMPVLISACYYRSKSFNSLWQFISS